ncbi:MAG TPA: hypothetical protein P5519_11130 [Spirochaetia bacterium]|nr:hypothetical protein [Spirochaetia bacterium]
MELTEQQQKWAAKRKQGASPKTLRDLLNKQKGRCALSGVEMIFDVNKGTPVSGGRGCHPLYAAVDHIDPGNREGGYQIICYALNDLKGHLPTDCFKALQETNEWKKLMSKWRNQAKKDATDREAFKRLLRPNATSKE